MAQKSWQVTVTTAGTAVQGPASPAGYYLIKPAPANTGKIYVGNDGAGDVASTTGYALSVGETAPMLLGSLADIWFDASVSGEKAHCLLHEALNF